VNDALADPPAWYVAGPLLGLIVVGVLAAINQRVGVLGGVSDFVERAVGRRAGLGWKAWFLVGVVLGGRSSWRCSAARRSATTTGG
jgi:hypothetical protein